MIEIVGVRFKKAGKIYYFDPNSLTLHPNDAVIVETTRGIEFGTIVKENTFLEEDEVLMPLKKVLRMAKPEDIIKQEENMEKEKDAFLICVDKIQEHNLDMKLIDVESTFDNNKLIFYFTSEGRVDFRELVKELASIFRTRIELRQIGVRDESKMLNGIGMCGRSLCCATFLSEFQPVSIKMAKEQNLSLNPSKISGICGRLMCCLKYEEAVYEELKAFMPNVGDTVVTDQGIGEVLFVSILKQEVKVAVKKEKTDDVEILFLKGNECRIVKTKKHEKTENKEAEE